MPHTAQIIAPNSLYYIDLRNVREEDFGVVLDLAEQCQLPAG